MEWKTEGYATWAGYPTDGDIELCIGCDVKYKMMNNFGQPTGSYGVIYSGAKGCITIPKGSVAGGDQRIYVGMNEQTPPAYSYINCRWTTSITPGSTVQVRMLQDCKDPTEYNDF